MGLGVWSCDLATINIVFLLLSPLLALPTDLFTSRGLIYALYIKTMSQDSQGTVVAVGYKRKMGT